MLRAESRLLFSVRRRFVPLSIAPPTLISAARFQQSAANAATTATKKELDDGRVFEGTFDSVSGAPLPGTKLSDSGDVYVGEYNSAWQKHGKGKATLTDGTVYEGRFEEDELVEGLVKMVDESGDTVEFRGTLKEGQFLHGTLSHSDYTYTGPFENNQPHGKGGVLTFATGAVQEGPFFRGQLHGDNCKWKLDSGQGIYIATFLHGVVTSGELRTATFTYEGEFNEKGQAHGVGRQEHHATSPKLIFKGHWAHGSLITGQCHTEDGEPVDWHNDPAAQEQLMSKESRMQREYMKGKVDESRSRFAEAKVHFAEDAETHYAQTGKRADGMDLGYEAGPLTGRKMAERQQVRAMADSKGARARVAEAAEDVSRQEQEMKAAWDRKQKMAAAAAEESSSKPQQKQKQEEPEAKSSVKQQTTQKAEVVPEISNWEIARAALMRQRGKQLTTADTLNDQFERFKLQRDKKGTDDAAAAPSTDKQSASSSSSSSSAEDEFVVDPAPAETMSSKPDRLRVDGNEPFVSMSAKAHRN